MKKVIEYKVTDLFKKNGKSYIEITIYQTKLKKRTKTFEWFSGKKYHEEIKDLQC